MYTSAADLTMYDSACYCIRARGTLDSHWSRWLHEMQLNVEASSSFSVLTLRGTLRDQAALMGVLNQLIQLGLPLISIELVTAADSCAYGGA